MLVIWPQQQISLTFSIRTHASGVGLCEMSVLSMESAEFDHEVWRTFCDVTFINMKHLTSQNLRHTS